MIVLLFSALVGSVVVSAAFGFFFMRSSKNMPKEWRHWKAEIWWQINGFTSLVEDHLLRRTNTVELTSRPGKLVVITGGNRGIGLHVVQKLIECDMTVVLGVRDTEAARANVEALVDITVAKATVYYHRLDIGSTESVRAFASYIKTKFTRIDLLINNAGIMAAPYQLTVDGFESQLAINYLGHFLLTHLLLPELKAAGNVKQRARIVNVSSCVHKLGRIDFDDIHGQKYYYPPEAYNQSKLAQVLFTKHLQAVLSSRDDGATVQVHAVHPGVVDTDLFVHSSSTYIPWVKRLLFKNAEEGARTIVYAAISPEIEGKGGSYLSNCRMTRTNAMTKDVALCEKLFKYTCDMLKIKDFEHIG